MIWFFAACPAFGQAKKTRQLTTADYGLWSTVSEQQISDYGGWMSYGLSYESGQDTLFVKNISNGRTFSFAKGTEGKFNGDKLFGCLLPDGRFALTDLKNGSTSTVQNTEGFTFAGGGKYVVMLCNADGKTSLRITDVKGKLLVGIAGVTEFATSPDGTKLVCAGKGASGGFVKLLQLGKEVSIKQITASTGEAFKTIVWQESSQAFAFVSTSGNPETVGSILLYKMSVAQLYRLDRDNASNWPEGIQAKCGQLASLNISDDGQRVFFPLLKSPPVKKDVDGPKVWNAADKVLLPYRERNTAPEDKATGVWWPQAGRFDVLDSSFGVIKMLNGNQQTALTSDAAPYLPSLKYDPDRDYYLVNLSTTQRVPFLKQQFYEYDNFPMTPDGKYVFYFRDGGWWAYNLAMQQHRNLTGKILCSFMDEKPNQPEVPAAYGIAAWSAKEGCVLVYDHYDIWKIYPDGKSAARLTHGRERGIIFRLSQAMLADQSGKAGTFRTIPCIDLKKALLLEARADDADKSGYYTVRDGKAEQVLSYERRSTKGLVKAKYSDAYIYIAEDYDSPPAIIAGHLDNRKQQVVYQSNLQHYRYGWGKSELLKFKDADSVERTATLFYPFDYDPAKKYPMVVHIYEDQSGTRHRYVNPTLQNGDGYNTTCFTSNGYFVLHPDIRHEMGNPGLSATRVVTAATKAAVAAAMADEKKIGLMGHSFGGYETFFIVTQTDIFAAAVAGAGFSDLMSSYLSMSNNYLRPESWRFEYQQLRMGMPLYGNLECYRENSPFTYAEQVSTPLLSWTGESDKDVDPHQSMEFYMAMRRLGKTHVMLRYPGERHSFSKAANQTDLTVRITEWFDHYLKGAARPGWTTPK